MKYRKSIAFDKAGMVFSESVLQTVSWCASLAVVGIELSQFLLAFWLVAASLFFLDFSFTSWSLMNSQVVHFTIAEVLLETHFAIGTDHHLIEVFVNLFAVMTFNAKMVCTEHLVAVFAGKRHPVNLSALLKCASFAEFLVFHIYFYNLNDSYWSDF